MHERRIALVTAATAYGKEGNHDVKTQSLAFTAVPNNPESTVAVKFDIVPLKPCKPNRTPGIGLLNEHELNFIKETPPIALAAAA